MRTAKSRNKHVAKISCDKVVTALLKLLCVDADFLTTNTQARIPLWLNHRVLISPFSSKSAAQRKHYVSVKVECNSLTWQMSTLCGLPWTYIIKLCNLHALCDFYQAFKVGHRCNTKTVKRRHKSFRGVWGVLLQKMFEFGESETLFLALIMRYVSEKSTSNLKMANNCKSL